MKFYTERSNKPIIPIIPIAHWGVIVYYKDDFYYYPIDFIVDEHGRVLTQEGMEEVILDTDVDDIIQLIKSTSFVNSGSLPLSIVIDCLLKTYNLTETQKRMLKMFRER